MSSGKGAEDLHKGRAQGAEPGLGKGRRAVGAALLFSSVGLMLYGLSRGEAAIVLNKAVNICLECIGLG